MDGHREHGMNSFTMRLAAMAGALAFTGMVTGAEAQSIYSAGDGLRFGVFGQVGLSDLKIKDDTIGTSSTATGANARFGGTFGYDWRINRTVLGIEADVAIGNASSKSDIYTFANDYYTSFRGRFGYYTQPDVLVYGTVGLGLTGAEYKSASGAVVGGSNGAVTKISSTLAGVAVGVGAEYDIYGMRLFSEYLFTAYDRWAFRTLGPSNGDHLSVEQTSHQLRLGIKFNLNPEYHVTPSPVYK